MLCLIRHAESLANIGSLSTDYAAIPLTNTGREQADEFAQSFSDSPDWIGVSPYLRARQTAEPFQARYPHVPVSEMPVQEFTYISPSRCVEGSPDSLQSHVASYWDKLDPDYNDGEGAESFADLMRRAEAFLADVASRPGVGIVFTHAQFIRAVLVLLSGPPLASKDSQLTSFYVFRRNVAVPNLSITRIDLDTGAYAIYAPGSTTPLKESKGYVKGVPTGSHCSGYVPNPASGFATMYEVNQCFQRSVEDLSAVEICERHSKLQLCDPD